MKTFCLTSLLILIFFICLEIDELSSEVNEVQQLTVVIDVSDEVRPRPVS